MKLLSKPHKLNINMRVRLLLISLLSLTLLSAPLKVLASDEVEDQISWLRANGGYFSDRVAYGAFDKTGVSGMFAIAPIQKGERIIVLPNKLLLTSGSQQDICTTAIMLAREYYLQGKSAYAPYVRYVFEFFPHEQNPRSWSATAKTLIKIIVGKELEPLNFGQGSFRESCEDEDRKEQDEKLDEILEAAWRIVLARSWGDKLLPVVDMLNHRNGKYHNVDQANSAHNGADVVIVALRDIKEGEAIYNSYNECPDIDCEGIALSYVTPQIFSDYGFVEQYPRRFNFESNDGKIIFDVLQEGNASKVNWRSPHPNAEQINFLRGHLNRLRKLYSTISNSVKSLKPHERKSILEYYEALVEAMEVAISSGEVPSLNDAAECHASDREGFCPADLPELDDLEETPDPLDYHKYVCDANVRDNVKGNLFFSESFKSYYQWIDYRYFYDSENKKVDKCLNLDGWIHSCSSYRPHYHEWLVHYPARFVKTVNRVLFMGGGDSMILNEVLKYPELETVIGLELDQQVVRTSFKHFNTQPHFDDERVMWWFGDAVKSLQMLPAEYYGTFDLIVIDLLSYVVESLMVTKDLGILEFTMRFLKPEGVLSFNEDFVSRSYDDYAKYMVDLNYLDVPILCQTHVSIGSNGIDFLTAKQFDHGVDSMVVAGEQKFDAWWNYRKASPPFASKLVEIGRSPFIVKPDTTRSSTIVVVEVEDSAGMKDATAISKAMGEAELTIISSHSPQPNVTFMVLEEGYAVLRAWGELKYQAVDVMLWSKPYLSVHQLMKDIFGGKLFSSFRIVSSGIRNDPPLNDPLYEKNPAGIPLIKQNVQRALFSNTKAFKAFVLEIIASVHHHDDPVIVLFCSSHGPCELEDNFEYSRETTSPNVFPVRSCNFEQEDTKSHHHCFKRTLEQMEMAAFSTKISEIVINTGVPKSMVQILYQIMSNSSVRDNLLAKRFMILTPTFDASWSKVLLERFRTILVKFHPSYHAEILLGNDLGPYKYQVDVFSSGNPKFYEYLASAMNQFKHTTGIGVELEKVRDGLLNYIPDYEASLTATDAHYYQMDTRHQWDSQNPVGMQTIFQFEIQSSLTPLSPGDKVMSNVESHVFVGTWILATIKSRNEDGTYDVIDENGIGKSRVVRNLLKEFEEPSQVRLMSGHVLVRKDDTWLQGKILEQLPDGLYKVHIYDNFGTQAIIQQKNIIKTVERHTKDQKDSISSTLLEKTLFYATNSNASVNLTQEYGNRGLIITAFWSKGSAILTWDAGNQVSLNLFTDDEDHTMHASFAKTFTDNIPFLTLVAHNQHPRGFGRVVNFKRDI